MSPIMPERPVVGQYPKDDANDSYSVVKSRAVPVRGEKHPTISGDISHEGPDWQPLVELLAKHNLRLTCHRGHGRKCPNWCATNKNRRTIEPQQCDHGHHYELMLQHNNPGDGIGKHVSCDWWGSVSDKTHGKMNNPYELASGFTEEPYENFSEWCGELGMNEDSINDKDSWYQIKRVRRGVIELFGDKIKANAFIIELQELIAA